MKKSLYNERDLRLECLKQAANIFVQQNSQKGYSKELIVDLATAFFDFVSKETLGFDE